MGEPGLLRDLGQEAGRLLRSRIAPLSPRHRRWRRFLASLPVDPDALPRPLPAPPDGDFVICGAPRSGTTLVAAMLFQPPRVVTVMEPWDGFRLTPAELFASLRAELESEGRLRRGKLDVGALERTGAVRWGSEGTATPPLDLAPGYALGVKWPAFWRYLDLLPVTRFVVCLRHPFDVVGSFKKQRGRLRHGLEYEIAFNRGLNRELTAATRRPSLRRVLLYDAVHRALLPHLGRPRVLAVRYERWFEDPQVQLDEITAFLGLGTGLRPLPIRRPEGRSSLSAGERELIRRRCRTAAALGYDLGDPAATSRREDGDDTVAASNGAAPAGEPT